MKRYKDTDLCQFFSKVSKVTECLDENETTPTVKNMRTGMLPSFF